MKYYIYCTNAEHATKHDDYVLTLSTDENLGIAGWMVVGELDFDTSTISKSDLTKAALAALDEKEGLVRSQLNNINVKRQELLCLEAPE